MDIKSSPILRGLLAFLLLHFATETFAQSSSGNTNLFVISLVVLAALLLIGIVVQVADNVLRVEAKQKGLDGKGNFGLFPAFKELTKGKLPAYLENEDVTILKKGHDILLQGVAERTIEPADQVTRYAVQPPNYVGISPIPKVVPEIGTSVKAGDVIFFDKKRPEIKYVAPVSGELIELNRGEKRAITELVILADKEIQYKALQAPDLESATREDIVNFLLENGGWTLIRQRPFQVVPDIDVVPDNIFISTFDSAPLAPDLNLVVAGNEDAFQKGLDVLNTLTEGKVHLGLDARGETPPSPAYVHALGVETHWFRGPHPCGNVGVQIHHIDPIRPSKRVWTLGVQDVITIGKMFSEGRYDASRVVAITGEPVTKPRYVRTYIGANLGELLQGTTLHNGLRLISGDVLSGEEKTATGCLNSADDQVTVIKEGNYYEMFGWLLPLTPRPSVSKTYPNFLFGDTRFEADTNTHGERRAFVMTGQYERMLPMDIYLQHLMKAIITQNYERMEGLGIQELNGEDIALCEFACTSKMPLQKILREGHDLMREQG